MKNFRKSVLAAAASVAIVLLNGCATATGAGLGAGAGYLAGDTEKGAIIGGSVGAVVDIVD